jgi:hypothetical protein
VERSSAVSAWDQFYDFWISQQTIPGNILGDVLIGGATFIIGKYKVAPWLHARHKERVDQQERQHQEVLEQQERQHHEVLEQHKKLLDLHQKHHQEVLEQHAKLLELSQAQHQQLVDLAQAVPAVVQAD